MTLTTFTMETPQWKTIRTFRTNYHNDSEQPFYVSPVICPLGLTTVRSDFYGIDYTICVKRWFCFHKV